MECGFGNGSDEKRRWKLTSVVFDIPNYIGRWIKVT